MLFIYIFIYVRHLDGAVQNVLMDNICINKVQDEPEKGTYISEAALQRCSTEKVSDNTHKIYRRITMLKCDFNKVALQLLRALKGCFWYLYCNRYVHAWNGSSHRNFLL